MAPVFQLAMQFPCQYFSDVFQCFTIRPFDYTSLLVTIFYSFSSYLEICMAISATTLFGCFVLFIRAEPQSACRNGGHGFRRYRMPK